MSNHNISPLQPITIKELITKVYGQPFTRKEYRRVYKLLQTLNKKASTQFLFQLGHTPKSPFFFSLFGLKQAGLECFSDSTLLEENENLKAKIEELEEELAYFRELE